MEVEEGHGHVSGVPAHIHDLRRDTLVHGYLVVRIKTMQKQKTNKQINSLIQVNDKSGHFNSMPKNTTVFESDLPVDIQVTHICKNTSCPTVTACHLTLVLEPWRAGASR